MWFKMKIKSICIFVISMLMMSGLSTSASKLKESNLSNYSDEINSPVYEVGDYWKYDAYIKGDYGTDISFDLSIQDMKYEVVEVLNEKYKLNINVPNGKITGSLSINLDVITISGNLINTKITGSALINKTDLGMVENQISLDGYIDKLIDIHFTIDMDGMFNPYYTNIDFPLDIGNSWIVPLTYYTAEADVNVAGLIDVQDQLVWFYTKENDFSCISEETINGFESLKVSGQAGSKNDYWYSKQAGTFVKADYKDIKLWIWETEDEDFYYLIDTFSMELTDTNYIPPNEPPSAPDKPSGPTTGRAGPEYSYCTEGGIDPEGQNVQYGFDFGDGSDIKWTDFVSSGIEACVSHNFPYTGGNFEIKAKTRDEQGGESGWSDILSVSMTPDDPPTIPLTPIGDTTEGIVGYSYIFTTSATDSEDDKIKYGFDLYGDNTVDYWSNLYDSGETINENLIWEKDGIFELKVKAKDEYGATSDWSGTISITITNEVPNKPNPPNGPSRPCVDVTNTYTVSTLDPDGHRVKFIFDWGDDETSTTDFVDSEAVASASHRWDEKGNYQIKVRAEDEYGKQSEWSDPLPIQVPRFKSMHNSKNFEFYLTKIYLFSYLSKQILNKLILNI